MLYKIARKKIFADAETEIDATCLSKYWALLSKFRDNIFHHTAFCSRDFITRMLIFVSRLNTEYNNMFTCCLLEDCVFVNIAVISSFLFQ